MENSSNQFPVKTGEWLITLLVSSIPLVGLIMLCVWAFGNNTDESKANWAKAMLIYSIILTFIIFLFFGVALSSFVALTT